MIRLILSALLALAAFTPSASAQDPPTEDAPPRFSKRMETAETDIAGLKRDMAEMKAALAKLTGSPAPRTVAAAAPPQIRHGFRASFLQNESQHCRSIDDSFTHGRLPPVCPR